MKPETELKEEIELTEKKLSELKEKLRQEQDKRIWINIPEEGIEITTKQQFNGETYLEILKKIKEETIATYDLLQRLRNSGKYEFLKKFWVGKQEAQKDEIKFLEKWESLFWQIKDCECCKCHKFKLQERLKKLIFKLNSEEKFFSSKP